MSISALMRSCQRPANCPAGGRRSRWSRRRREPVPGLPLPSKAWTGFFSSLPAEIPERHGLAAQRARHPASPRLEALQGILAYGAVKASFHGAAVAQPLQARVREQADHAVGGSLAVNAQPGILANDLRPSRGQIEAHDPRHLQIRGKQRIRACPAGKQPGCNCSRQKVSSSHDLFHRTLGEHVPRADKTRL